MMDEFDKVMQEWRRMCCHTNCDPTRSSVLEDCPIRLLLGTDCSMNNMDLNSMKQIERIVMKWSEEHKERVYPTWGEWLKEKGIVDIEHVPLVSNATTTEYVSAVKTMPLFYRPIPESTAKKLWIDPKEE